MNPGALATNTRELEGRSFAEPPPASLLRGRWQRFFIQFNFLRLGGEGWVFPRFLSLH